MVQRRERVVSALMAVAVGVATLAVYVATAASSLTWANYGIDGGDLVTAAVTLGVAHPTGYPTYALLGHVFTWFPLGDLAHRVTLMSAVSAALASALFALLLARATPGEGVWRGLTGLVGGLSIGLSSSLWSQAVIAEVHALNLLFVVFGLWLLWELRPENANLGMQPLLLAAALGLGMGNHITLGLMLAPVIVLVWLRGRRRPHDRRRLLWLVPAFLAGLSVYAYLPLRAAANPPVNWGDPRTLQGFLWTITAQAYKNLAFAFPAGGIASRVGAWSSLLIDSFGYVGLALSVGGLFFGRSRSRVLDYSTWWMIGAYSVFAIGYNTADSTDYLIPAHLAFAYWLALGFNALALGLSGLSGWRRRLAHGGIIVLTIGGWLWGIPETWRQVDARNQHDAVDYGHMVMTEAPQNAVVLTWTALDSFPLWYYQFAEHQRLDLALVVVPLTQFSWYRDQLSMQYPDLSIPDEQDLLQQDPTTPAPELWGRPVCGVHTPDPGSSRMSLICQSPSSKAQAQP